VITRRHPDRVRREIGVGEARIVWLSKNTAPDAINPAPLDALNSVIVEFIEAHAGAGVIVLEGTEYLVINNGFDQTRRFIQHTREFVAERKAILLVPLDPDAFSPEERGVIERVATMIKPQIAKTVVRLIPRRPDLVAESKDVGALLTTAWDLDETPRTVAEKIRDAQRALIPFIVLIAGGEIRSRTLNVIHHAKGESWMSLDNLLRAAKQWASGAS